MITELQFLAIAAFLIWCLASSLGGVVADPEEARLVWREHAPAGWSAWREAHFGLTAADRRVLAEPESALDTAARAALLDTVMHQTRNPDSDAVQFAIVRMSSEGPHATVVFVSDHLSVTSVSRAAEPSPGARP
jgi:hypothetical protein